MTDSLPLKPLLSARGLCKAYGGRQVVQQVEIEVHEGEILTIIGPNGAGKTTVLKLLLGLEKPDAGHVHRAPDLRIGYVPQQCHISPAMPLSLEGFMRAGNPKISVVQVSAALAAMGIEKLADQPMHGLSGGEMRRALIARALLSNPQILVLDEPVAGVDVTGQGELYRRIRSLAEERHMAVLMVSHDLFVVMAGSHRVICLNHHVCCAGKPSLVGAHPEFVALFGADVAAQLATYTHHHDHHHTLKGEVVAGHHHEGCSHA